MRKVSPVRLAEMVSPVRKVSKDPKVRRESVAGKARPGRRVRKGQSDPKDPRVIAVMLDLKALSLESKDLKDLKDHQDLKDLKGPLARRALLAQVSPTSRVWWTARRIGLTTHSNGICISLTRLISTPSGMARSGVTSQPAGQLRMHLAIPSLTSDTTWTGARVCSTRLTMARAMSVISRAGLPLSR